MDISGEQWNHVPEYLDPKENKAKFAPIQRAQDLSANNNLLPKTKRKGKETKQIVKTAHCSI